MREKVRISQDKSHTFKKKRSHKLKKWNTIHEKESMNLED